MHAARPRGRGLLALGIVASLALGARVAPAPVHATAPPPVASVSPSTVPLGGAVGLSGAGFAAGETITVTISGLNAALATLKAQPDGTVPSTQLTVPATATVGQTVVALAAGAHTLTLTGATSGLTATASLALVPSAGASPAAVPLGGQVTVSGAGFAANEQVAVAISQMNGLLATLTADGNGLVAPVAVTVPASFTVGASTSALSPGAHTLTLTGNASARSASAQVTLEPSATVSPDTAPLGSQVTVSGAGFGANEQVTVAISGTAGTLATLTADNNGIVQPAGVVIPVSAPTGAQALTLTGARSQRSPSAPITLTAPTSAATLVVTPTTVNQGGLATVSGSGFAANEGVSIAASGLVTPLASLSANAQGQLAPAGVTIPFDLPPGAHTLQATGAASGRVATAGITVVALAPTIAANVTTLAPGSTVSVTGQGFAPQEQVTFSLNGAALATSPAVITTTNGAFAATFTVPASILSGANTISAIGNQSRAVASIALQGQPPAATTLYFAGADTGQARAVPLTPASGVYWRLLVAMNLRPAPSTSPTSRLLVPAGTTVKEWGLQPSVRWVHITWNGHDGYLLAGNMLPRGVRVFTSSDRATLAILNTNAQAAHIALTFYYQNGAPGHAGLTIPAFSRGTADVNALAGSGRVFGLKLSADRAVSAQLQVARDGEDGFSMPGVSAPATAWYLAEGYTGADFHETLALLNPGTAASRVLLRLLPAAGRAARTATVVVAPWSTYVVDVNRLMPAQSVSVIATASQPIVLARTISFGPDGYGITAKPGVNAPATSWVFAQGQTTGRFRTYLSILNPNTQGTYVTASFYAGARGSVAGRTVYVPGLTRVTIPVNRYAGSGNVAAVVTGGLPVVVERPTYASASSGRVAAADVFGRNGAGLSWTFPGGDTRAQRELLYVFNPSARTAAIEATFYGSNGQTASWRFSVPPTSQITVDVRALALDPTPQHGLTLRATNGVGVVAEQTIIAPRNAALTGTQGFAS